MSLMKPNLLVSFLVNILRVDQCSLIGEPRLLRATKNRQVGYEAFQNGIQFLGV